MNEPSKESPGVTEAPAASTDALQQRVLDLEAEVQRLQEVIARLMAHNEIILKGLPEKQRGVLQSIRQLPANEDSFSEAERLLGELAGEPFTQAFTNSLKALLWEKNWGVVCTAKNCGKPATVLWSKDVRYTSGGRAKFTHSGAPHGSMTHIPTFKIVKKIDRRSVRD